MLNLNASLTKAGIEYSTIWSEDFTDEFFTSGLKSWLETGKIEHETAHVKTFDESDAPAESVEIGTSFAREFKHQKAIMGVFDEGCMGMYNAIIPDEMLHPTGIFKERLSQSTLYAKMLTVKDDEAQAVYDWLKDKGMTFHFGDE